MSYFKKKYKDIEIVILTGDITQQLADAVVNPANSLMIMGGGVAGAIKRAGGKGIEDQAIQQARVPVGEAVATTAGSLKAKYVIHAPTMTRPAMRIGKGNVSLATRGVLKCAKQHEIKSIAFPMMGTGVGGVNPKEAAEAMLHQLKRHVDKGTALREVILVGFTEELAKIFRDAIDEVFKLRR
ncbi:MAG: macro domain-containing protein [Thermoproteota archaeon]|nr:macro domain-containing protein [Thermoproteota archaeon]